jgi:hypothetical protein
MGPPISSPTASAANAAADVDDDWGDWGPAGRKARLSPGPVLGPLQVPSQAPWQADAVPDAWHQPPGDGVDYGESPEDVFSYLCNEYGVGRPAFLALRLMQISGVG